MSPEEIAAQSGGQTAFLVWPQRGSVFAERAMRLRQLASGHPMGDYLRAMSALAQAQQRQLDRLGVPELPAADALANAANLATPPLPATDFEPPQVWREIARALAAELMPALPEAGQLTLRSLAGADDAFLDTQADALLHGVAAGVDLGAAPVIGAALQVVWTGACLALKDSAWPVPSAAIHLTEAGRCPCCGSRPTASITQSGGESLGQRYLHCSLCNLRWYMQRSRCAHCGDSAQISFHSLDRADSTESDGARAAQAAIQAECCDACNRYLKIVHTDRDPFVEPVADDLASVTLDLLVGETGKLRHGMNFMLLFAEADGPPPDPGAR
ncbi:formate dehydrogenase accessory protein FdhE [beta proteobacterium AAP99]|nr:formate dehydrogenase accessory protein FdhE [beta proteobacterium AAP99]